MNVNFKYLLPLCIFILFLSLSISFAQDSIPAKKPKKVELFPFPVIAFAPETNLQLGAFTSIVVKGKADLSNKFYRPSTFNVFAIASLRSQIRLGNEMDLFFGKGWNLYTFLRYYINPDFYYGIGYNTLADDEEVYTEEFSRLNGRFMKSVGSDKFFVGMAYDFQDNQMYGLKKGKVLEQHIVNGSKGGYALGVGPSLRYDTRDNIIYPTKGIQITSEAIFYNFGTYNYSNFTTDARTFFNIRGDKNVIGLQIFLNFTDGYDIPFFKLPRLGGPNSMRGIIENRFRDYQAMYFQGEYRRIIWKPIGIAFFGAVGTVGPSVDQFYDLKYAYGAGVRIKLLKESRLNLRIDYGLGSDNQSGLYFTVREAF